MVEGRRLPRGWGGDGAFVGSRGPGGTRKPTANQIANEELKTRIWDSMESGVGYRVKELAKLVGMESFSKCSALVKQLKDSGRVARSEEKGVAYFTKVE